MFNQIVFVFVGIADLQNRYRSVWMFRDLFSQLGHSYFWLSPMFEAIADEFARKTMMNQVG